MFQGYRIGCIILMAGKGERFGSTVPKQFHHLSGKPIYFHTLQAVLFSGFVDELILCCHPDWIEWVRSSLPKSSCLIHVIEGGSTRQESSYKGLTHFLKSPDFVLIHDGVRPFVSQEILQENLRLVLKTGAVDTCIPSADTLVYAPDRNKIHSIPKREEFLRGQTPQTFSYPLILQAHQASKETNCSDDCQLVNRLGHPLAIACGDEYNIKITSELDLFLAEQILRLRMHKKQELSSESFVGKHYCVIGGKGGIGSAIVQTLKNKGAQITVLSRQTQPSLDLRNLKSIQTVFQYAAPFDGLINCAGVLYAKSLDQMTIEEIEEQIDINLKGVVFCCKIAPLKRGAHVINIASSSFSRGRKDLAIYAATKAGVVNFTQGFAEERTDLHVFTVIPKRVNTALRRKNFPNENEEWLLEPQEVADTVVSLLQKQEGSGMLVEIRKKQMSSMI